MFEHSKAFSGFSTDDPGKAAAFYRDVLGLRVSEGQWGIVTLHLAGDRDTIVYPKPDHVPATFTVLNFPVPEIGPAVEELARRGVVFQQGKDIDEHGVFRGGGPLIAWFEDPAGNVLSVIEESSGE